MFICSSMPIGRSDTPGPPRVVCTETWREVTSPSNPPACSTVLPAASCLPACFSAHKHTHVAKPISLGFRGKHEHGIFSYFLFIGRTILIRLYSILTFLRKKIYWRNIFVYKYTKMFTEHYWLVSETNSGNIQPRFQYSQCLWNINADWFFQWITQINASCMKDFSRSGPISFKPK